MKRFLVVLWCAAMVAGCGGRSEAPKDKAAKRKPILGRKTQEIVDLQKRKADFQEVKVKARASDGLTLNPGRAYGGVVSKAAKLKIQHAMRLFKAEHDRYPKDYDEFMARIIKANRIKLPVLPGGLEYAYDSDSHELKTVKKR